jgi:hypothetical protein
MVTNSSAGGQIAGGGTTAGTMSKQRLVAVTFRESAGPLAGYVSAAKGSGYVESIVPAALLADGSWRAVDKERADGFGIVRREGPVSAQRVAHYFVPMANVACVTYEGIEEPKAK